MMMDVRDVPSHSDEVFDTQTVGLSGIIGVPARVLVDLLSDIHTIELYGFPSVVTRCLLETLLLPNELNAIRRCTLNFGAFQGRMLREQLIFSGPKRDGTTDSVARGDSCDLLTCAHAIQLRYLDGTDAEADRSPFGVEARHALVAAVTTFTVTPITTSPYQCFLQVCTALQMRSETRWDAARRDVCAFWTAYGRELFTAIQSYVVSKAYSPQELHHVDEAEVDAQGLMASLENTYMDLVADPERSLGGDEVRDVLERVLVHSRRLLSAYRRVRLQSLAERTVPAASRTTAEFVNAAPAPSSSASPVTAAHVAQRLQVGDHIKAERDALRVRAIVEMQRQWDLLDDSASKTIDEAGKPAGQATPLPATMIDVRAPSATAAASAGDVPMTARWTTPYPALSSSRAPAPQDPSCDPYAPRPPDSRQKALLARVAAASRQADMTAPAPTTVTARGERPHVSRGSPARLTLTHTQMTEPSASQPTTQGKTMRIQDAADKMAGLSSAPISTLRSLPLSTILAQQDQLDEDALTQELFQRFWRGHTGEPSKSTTMTSAPCPKTVERRQSVSGHSAKGTTSTTKLPPLQTTPVRELNLPADGIQRESPHAPRSRPVPTAAATPAVAAPPYTTDRRYWTVEDIVDMLRAMDDAGCLYTVVKRLSAGDQTGEPQSKRHSATRSRVNLSLDMTAADAPQLPHPLPLTTTSFAAASPEAVPSSSFAAYKREAQRGFLERYSCPSADRLGSSFGGESTPTNSNIGSPPSSTFNGVEARAMSPSFTNGSDTQMHSAASTRQQPFGYFTHKIGRVSSRPAKGLATTALAESALARVEAVLSAMETPEHAFLRYKADRDAQRETTVCFVPPLLRRDLPAVLQAAQTSEPSLTLSDVRSRQATEDAALMQRREAALQRTAEALIDKFAYRQTGRLYVDEARLVLAHILNS